MEQSINEENYENVTQIIQTLVGPKESSTGGIQPCFTYNPPGSNQPGRIPTKNVSVKRENLNQCEFERMYFLLSHMAKYSFLH